MLSSKANISRLFSFVSFLLTTTASSPPTAQVKNGTVQGRHSPEWSQDFFLGIPYAQPPLGELRFRWPQPMNSSFDGRFDAAEYGYSCYQYDTDFDLSEDCLTLNVVRPDGYEDQSLPVLVWIYGGGLFEGSTADPRYNLSGIVQTAAESDQPFVAVSMNYRLGVWGFLQTPAILNEGSTNAGLLDQRLALRWIQENVESFGGDPNRVTVWGESAGAQSIGLHMHSYGGRDDGLFHAAILESGGPVGASLNTLPYYQFAYENLTRTVGCGDSSDQLACLRSISSDELFKSNYTVVWNPLVDGDFLTTYPSELAAQGKFIHVPLLNGANSDEGASFNIGGLDNETAIANGLLYWRNYALAPDSIRTILDLYPNNPGPDEVPFSNPTDEIFPERGLQWRRDATIGGDIVMIGQRRKTCEEFVKGGVEDVYSYRFDTPPWNASEPVTAQHFDNVMFSFQNISGALGPLPEFQTHLDLSKSIGKAYASFVSGFQPNGAAAGEQKGSNVTGLPMWPRYSLEAPTNMVLNSNGSFVEADTWRREGIAFINSISRELLA